MIKLVLEDLEEETRIEVHAKSDCDIMQLQYNMRELFCTSVRGAIRPLPVIPPVPEAVVVPVALTPRPGQPQQGTTVGPKPPADDDLVLTDSSDAKRNEMVDSGVTITMPLPIDDDDEIPF